MSSTSTRTSTNDNTSSSTFRVNYSEYVADITGSPKTVRKLPTAGIGHHINPLHNPYPNRQNQPTQQQQQQQQQPQTATIMPQYGGGGEKCARCLKSVYLAERKVGAGRAFHSSCFNCFTCKRKLDATHLSEHKGEIYCKSCYTKQFGAHGLISGVTMSTEQTSTYENRYGRRPSYGNDLDRSTETFQQTRQRSNSSENVFRDNSSSTPTNQRYSNTSREHISTGNQRKNSVDNLVDSKYRRSPSPTGFRIPVEYKTNDSQPTKSTEDNDRRKYSYDGEKLSYGNNKTSALVDIPVVVQSKRTDSTIDRMETPINPIQDNQRDRSRSPSITSNDSYQRQSNLSDNYSRLSIDEDKINRKYSTDSPMNTIVTENPVSNRNYYHSSSTSSYETKYRSSNSNTNNYEREQRSREASPTPIGGYISSSSTASTTRTQRVNDTPKDYTEGYTPQHEYMNTQTSSNFNERRSPSPSNNTRPISSINDFISKTNIVGNTTSTGNQLSALGALIPNSRRRNFNDDNDDDDGFDN
ncbi:hypothetical protein I4U23_006706 [Adineta vaga]|nr:hypothetical protein I4U23_006706 [Adineta vaga]